MSESQDYGDQLKDVLTMGKAVGPIVHDARIQAICLAHGVLEIWTANRDFSRFKGMRAKNPLL